MTHPIVQPPNGADAQLDKTKNEIDRIHKKDLARHRGNGHFHSLCLRDAALYAVTYHYLPARPNIGISTTPISTVGMLSSRQYSTHAYASSTV